LTTIDDFDELKPIDSLEDEDLGIPPHEFKELCEEHSEPEVCKPKKGMKKKKKTVMKKVENRHSEQVVKNFYKVQKIS
jgi:DNA-binding transcriptional MerR regulator